MCINTAINGPNNNNAHDDDNNSTTDEEKGVEEEQTEKLLCQPSWLSSESYGLWILLVSAMFYAIMACFVQLSVAETNISSAELVFLRAVFQGFAVVICMIWCKEEETNNNDNNHEKVLKPVIYQPFGRPHVRRIVILRGFVGAIGFLLYYHTISVLPLGDAVSILSLSPIIAILAGSIFLKEPIRIAHLVAAFTSIVGSFFLARPNFLFGNDDDSSSGVSIGHITGICGSCTGAAVYVLIRYAGKQNVHTLQLLFSWCFFSIINSLLMGVAFPYMMVTIYGFSTTSTIFALPQSAISWFYILNMCVFGSAAHFSMNYAARLAPAGLASLIRSSGILWSFLLEILIFHQIPPLFTIYGVVLILSSLTIVALDKKQQQKHTSKNVTKNDDKVPLLINVEGKQQNYDSIVK
mmetsp:Transcript_42839/g.48677  ORF Transcript_42839/g.48677 Transcript_42839/m.48677 type:complete len:409 (+) Transcript_42839:55-1281(+)